MKRNLIIIIILLLLGGGYLLLQSRQSSSITPTPTPVPSPTTAVENTPTTAQISPSIPSSTFCSPSQLQATMQSEGAAGNIYVTLTLKNISKTSCQVIGNNMPSVNYPISVTNFKTVSKKQPTTPIFTLTQNQTIYSLVHYPNGPQCQGKTTGVNAGVSYAISTKDIISFKPTMGVTLVIPSCESTSEITNIDVYPFSLQQVTP